MPPEQLTQLTWGARLRLERVAEGHRVVVSMPESVGDLTQACSVLLEQGDVCVAEYVPREAMFLHWTERFVEYAARLGVADIDGEVEGIENFLRSLIERNQAFATACLRAVHRALPVPGAPHMQEPVSDVPILDREGLPDPEAGQEAQLGEEAPLSRHAPDHPEQVADGDVVAAFPGDRDSAARRWKW